MTLSSFLFLSAKAIPHPCGRPCPNEPATTCTPAVSFGTECLYSIRPNLRRFCRVFAKSIISRTCDFFCLNFCTLSEITGFILCLCLVRLRLKKRFQVLKNVWKNQRKIKKILFLVSVPRSPTQSSRVLLPKDQLRRQMLLLNLLRKQRLTRR